MDERAPQRIAGEEGQHIRRATGGTTHMFGAAIVSRRTVSARSAHVRIARRPRVCAGHLFDVGAPDEEDGRGKMREVVGRSSHVFRRRARSGHHPHTSPDDFVISGEVASDVTCVSPDGPGAMSWDAPRNFGRAVSPGVIGSRRSRGGSSVWMALSTAMETAPGQIWP